ncbi:hypothetical protein, partial [Kaarinaea lacus]
MKNWFSRWAQPLFGKADLPGKVHADTSRRRFLGGLIAGTGLAAIGPLKAQESQEQEEELRFPGDPPEHKVVYQFNKGDEATQKAILFSVGAMLRKWGDNVHIVVVAIGPGSHVLAKNPKREVPK